MFILVQANDYKKHTDLLKQMHVLRKKVFHDELEWEVPVCDGQERDRYDELEPAYLLWTDTRKKKLYGSVRLMPTTGPTLLSDVFRSTYPSNVNLSHPGIWEGTRMCVDTQLLETDYPELSSMQAMCKLLLGLGECALAHGIHTMISNYEPHFKRIYQRAGASLDEIGRADGYGKRPVCCGVFDVTDNVVKAMREKQNQATPLYSRPAFKAAFNKYQAQVKETQFEAYQIAV